jgi:phenylacetate-CoA ligase
MGESLSPEVRERIETAFGVPVRNLYSTTEGGYIASPCPAGHGLHVHSENVLAEVLDADGRPCRPGETGRLVFTSLHNFMTPFIRYEILDDVTMAEGPCPCGRELLLWKHVEGRRHALLRLPGGGRKNSIGITLGLRQVGGFHQFQFVQRGLDHMLVRVVPDRSWRPGSAERLRQVVRREYGSPIRVDVEEVNALPRTAGGKVKLFINELDGSP